MTLQRAQSLVDFLALPAPDLVHQSFRLLLGRAPSPFEQEDRERALRLDCDRIAMIADIYQSPEAIAYRHVQPAGQGCELIEATDRRALLREMKRFVKMYRRSRQWWRWLGRGRRHRLISNIESEVGLVRIGCSVARERDQLLQATEAMREQIARSIEDTVATVRQDIARTREDGQADLRAMIAQSNDALESAVSALRDQSRHALAEVAAREAELRAELDQARIETCDALALIRDDAQARFDRLVESQRAEAAAAAPSIQKVDAMQIGPHARHILLRMRTAHGDGGQG